MPSILSARWILPITSPPIHQGAVAFESGRIIAVEPLSEIFNKFPGTAVKDLGEAAILPGLVNVHTHLELTAFRGRLEIPHFQNWIAQLVALKSEKMGEDDLLTSARLGCIESIKAGITTVADTSSSSATLAALIESGQRGIVFQECFGPDGGHAEDSIDNLKKDLDALQDRLEKAGSSTRSRLSVGISPHAPYTVSARLYELSARYAVDQKLDVAIHAAESADEENLLRDGSGAFGDALRRRGIELSPPGCSTIKYFDRLGVLHARPLLIHCVTVDEDDISLIANSDARVAHCPKSNSKFGHGIAPLIEMHRAGVRVGLGTDSVASNNNCDMIEESRFCSLLHRARQKDAYLCSAEDMLHLMTIDGARTLSMEDEIGSLEPGKQADLIAIDLTRAHNTPHYDPAAAIVFSCSGRDVVMMVVAGRVIYDGREVTTLDEESVLRQSIGTQNTLN